MRQVRHDALLDLRVDAGCVHVLSDRGVRNDEAVGPAVRQPLWEVREQRLHAAAQLGVGLRHGVDDARPRRKVREPKLERPAFGEERPRLGANLVGQLHERCKRIEQRHMEGNPARDSGNSEVPPHGVERACTLDHDDERRLHAPRAYDRRVAPQLTVVGSINLDLVAKVERLPRPGETLTGATVDRIPGGKGANQAVAAARLGASVRMVGCVGRDANAADALAGLKEAGVELAVREVGAPTGVAIILVASDGENQIVVIPGANGEVRDFSAPGHVLCQLEIPDAALDEARNQADWLCVNAAPARPLVVDADLVVANRYEAEVVGDQPLLAVTLGEEGAVLLEHGREVARARPPRVVAVDGTAAGDAFTAGLVDSLLEDRDWEEALRRACAAGALAASRYGAQPSLPTADEVDAILRA